MKFGPLILVVAAACGSSQLGNGGTGGTSAAGTAGTSGAAGTTGVGGTTGDGGTTGSGGSIGGGGSIGDGGTTGRGGTTGSGGSIGDGGTTGIGGSIGGGGSIGAAGTSGLGGATGAAGTVGTGGSANAGGKGGSSCLSDGFGGGTGGGAAAETCSCAGGGGLSIEVKGDGATLSLTSADVSGSTCSSSAPPWAKDANGEVQRIESIQACAGPGAQPPCLFLVPWQQGCFYSSTYTDRAGHMFKGQVQVRTNWNGSQSLMQVLEGDYEMLLEDGRTLSGHLRVCLLARITWA